MKRPDLCLQVLVCQRQSLQWHQWRLWKSNLSMTKLLLIQSIVDFFMGYAVLLQNRVRTLLSLNTILSVIHRCLVFISLPWIKNMQTWFDFTCTVLIIMEIYIKSIFFGHMITCIISQFPIPSHIPYHNWAKIEGKFNQVPRMICSRFVHHSSWPEGTTKL